MRKVVLNTNVMIFRYIKMKKRLLHTFVTFILSLLLQSYTAMLCPIYCKSA